MVTRKTAANVFFMMLGQNLGVRKALCGKVAMVVAKEICKEG